MCRMYLAWKSIQNKRIPYANYTSWLIMLENIIILRLAQWGSHMSHESTQMSLTNFYEYWVWTFWLTWWNKVPISAIPRIFRPVSRVGGGEIGAAQTKFKVHSVTTSRDWLFFNEHENARKWRYTYALLSVARKRLENVKLLRRLAPGFVRNFSKVRRKTLIMKSSSSWIQDIFLFQIKQC